MRFSTVAIVASVLAVASALDYPFKPNGDCVQSCLDSVGKDMFADFTSDPNNPNFIKSLGYAHDRGTPKYTNYMTKTGLCISKCPQAQLNLYNEQYDAKNTWYLANKNGGTTEPGVAPSATGSAPAPGTTGSASGAPSKPSGTSSGAPTKPTTPPNAASNVVASAGLIGAAAIGAAALLF